MDLDFWAWPHRLCCSFAYPLFWPFPCNHSWVSRPISIFLTVWSLRLLRPRLFNWLYTWSPHHCPLLPFTFFMVSSHFIHLPTCYCAPVMSWALCQVWWENQERTQGPESPLNMKLTAWWEDDTVSRHSPYRSLTLLLTPSFIPRKKTRESCGKRLCGSHSMPPLGSWHS